MKRTLKIAAVGLLIVGLFTACVPNIELSGYAWTANGQQTIDHQKVETELALVCNSPNGGMLFLSESYPYEMGFCMALPFTYTWNDNEGTATATLELPDDYLDRKGVAKMKKDLKINMHYTKTEGLVVTSNDIEHLLEFPCTNTPMTKKDFAKPASLVGTRWVAEIDDEIDFSDNETAHYRYELEFVNDKGAVLVLIMKEDGSDESEMERWNVNYSYSNGVGSISIYSFGETAKGGFYMPDDNHMTFSDGENLLKFVKQ